jgi:hypothetical protein
MESDYLRSAKRRHLLQRSATLSAVLGVVSLILAFLLPRLVATRRFCVSDWDLTTPGGFRQTRSSGTPLADGEFVRLSLIGNVIVRVELAVPTTKG